MSAPWGWDRRGEHGPVGLLARWWCARRVHRIKIELARRRGADRGLDPIERDGGGAGEVRHGDGT